MVSDGFEPFGGSEEKGEAEQAGEEEYKGYHGRSVCSLRSLTFRFRSSLEWPGDIMLIMWSNKVRTSNRERVISSFIVASANDDRPRTNGVPYRTRDGRNAITTGASK